MLAVLIMVFSAFAVISDRSPEASAVPEPQTSLQAEVVYHAAESAITVDPDYNAATSYTAQKSFIYYGTVISTEYNPQVWEFSTERWFALVNDTDGKEKYAEGVTYVFTGWKIATAGTVSESVFTPTAFTSVQDPGDVILYDSSDGHWYVGSDQVDIDADEGRIHIYATWGLLVHVVTNPDHSYSWTDGSKYQNIVLFTGEQKIATKADQNIGILGYFNGTTTGFTVRAADIDNVAGSALVDTDVNDFPLKSPVIIDNLTVKFRSSKAGDYIDINANSKVFIIGTGIKSVPTSGSPKAGYGQYASFHGGLNGDTKMIIHSGIYSSIYGGGKVG
jgi:hypothetical protein